MTLAKLNKLWVKLGRVTVDDDGLIETKFLHFPIGTHREVVWHWFEEQHPKFSAGDMINSIRSKSEKTV